MNRPVLVAAGVVAIVAAACGGRGEGPTLLEAPPGTPDGPRQERPPVVEVVPAREAPARELPPPLDPDADPTTALGDLRSRYLPVWSPDLDWAFPPEVCGSDWALDGIAEPISAANLGILGDPIAAAALSVMRYEHLLSRAFTAPDVLGQVCVAVAAVGAARSDALDLLASLLATGTRESGSAVRPEAVHVVAASPAGALAVACVTPGYPDVVTAGGEAVEAVEGLAGSSRLQAYLLAVSAGLEDTVTDISYRVSDIEHLPADTCGELEAWAAEWDLIVGEWAATGQIWVPVHRTITTDDLCATPPPTASAECPRDWP